MPSLFISYRRTDSPDTVKLIHERLKRRLPRWNIFYDHESIPLGDQFPERLRAKVAEATIVLVIIGPKWLEILHERKSSAVDHVRAEVRLALELAGSVVPILVGHAIMPTDADLAGFAGLEPLLQRNGRPVRPDPDFDGDLEAIITHIKQFDSDEAIGVTLADKYTLTAEIAHGGMGVVYLAEQKQPVKRTVAVKLIKPGMDSRDVLARFDAERQALAVMDHPNIAKVHDAGMTASGRPFFVMEYVKGVSITQYCDEKKLTPQERLNLFIPVCNAVQHAHQKGIIHRDIKPSNVLVEVIDGKPVPKVIDFGLAKALGQKLTDQTLYTALDMRVGTLEYSAPEQAAGRSFDVDTRSDIYSLGVLLYELLTGAPPFTHEELLKIGEEEMRRVIREDEPTKPSKKLSSSGELPAIAANRHLEPNKLTRLVQGDLDWIVMKCLEKEQARRYETANQLGQELQRFLADEPVQAGPPSANYRVKKFLRRNRGPVIAAAFVFLALIAGVIGTSIGLVMAERAREAEAKQGELTAAALAKSEENRKLAERRFDEKRGALDEMLQSFSDDRLKLLPGSQQIREVFFEKGLEQYAQILRERQDDPAIQARLADSYRELGVLRGEVGAPAEALAALQKAVALRRQMTAAAPDDATAATALGHALFQLGQFLFEQRQTKDAVAPVQDSVDIFTRLLTQHPGNTVYKAGLGRGLTRLASLKPELDQEKTLGRARDLLQEAAQELPADADVLTELARALNNLAASLPPARQSAAEGLDLYDEARKSAEKALALNPAHSLAHSIRLRAIQNRAAQLAKAGRDLERVRLLEEAVSDSKAFVRKNPAVVRAYLTQADLQGALAWSYRKLSRFDEAIALWEELARIHEGLSQRFPENEGYLIDRIDALANAVDIDMGRSRLSNAASAEDRIVAGSEDAMRLHPRSPRILGRFVRAYYFRSVIEERQKRTREALRFCQDGLAFFGRYRTLQGGDVDPAYQAFLCTIQATDCAKKMKDMAGAIKIAEEGSTIAEGFSTPAMQRERLDLLITLAECCDDAGQTEKAVATWSRARDEATRLIKETSFDFGARVKLKDSLQHLANLYRRTKDLQAEIQTARALLNVWSYFDGKDYSKLLAETADMNEGSANRLRNALVTPPKMMSFAVTHKIYIVEALQPFEDQVRWIEEVQGIKYPEDEAKTIREWHKKAVENKVSFVELCNYAYGTGTIDDEHKLRITQVLDEITRLSQKLEATPGLPMRRRLAESYTTLAEEYSFYSGSLDAGARSVETALSYLDLTPQGDPRHPEDRRALAKLRFVQAKLEQEGGKDERAYDAFLQSLRLFPATLRSGWGPDDRRLDLGKLCKKLGRKTEAAYWYLTAAELGDNAAVVALGQLYLEEPGVGAILPQQLVQNLEALGRTTPAAKDKQNEVDQLREVWKKHRVEALVANPTLHPAERGRLLAELEAFDQAENILRGALKKSPNDTQLQTALAICYRKLGSSLYYKERYDDATIAYKRSLEAGGDTDSPELLADYLRALIVSGQAKHVHAQATRFGVGGPEAPKNTNGDPSWDHVTWGLCAVAAVLIGEDCAPFLAKARATAPVVRISWNWGNVKEWRGMPRLMPDQKTRLDALTRELDSIMIESRSGQNASVFERIIAGEYAVILLQGKNTRGDMIYTYVRVGYADIRRLYAALHSGKGFNPSEYGVVVAAGKGEPPADVRREVAKTYALFSPITPKSFGRDAPATTEGDKLDPYLIAVSRGMHFLREGRYDDALVQLKTASEFKQAVADDYTQLGRCYGRLSRWDEAYDAHKKASELEAKQTTGTDASLGFLEAFILSERPEKSEPFIADLMEKKWQPREEKTNRLNQASAMFYGLQAVAQRMMGKDAAELEKKMRQYTALTKMQSMEWRWDEMDDWLKATKLAPDRKAAVEKIIGELKGLSSQAPK